MFERISRETTAMTYKGKHYVGYLFSVGMERGSYDFFVSSR